MLLSILILVSKLYLILFSFYLEGNKIFFFQNLINFIQQSSELKAKINQIKPNQIKETQANSPNFAFSKINFKKANTIAKNLYTCLTLMQVIKFLLNLRSLTECKLNKRTTKTKGAKIVLQHRRLLQHNGKIGQLTLETK